LFFCGHFFISLPRSYDLGAGVSCERLFASSSGCLTLFAEAVSEHYSDKRHIKGAIQTCELKTKG
jgi:hypothetical protein